MKYLKLFENFNDYDPYELMMIPPYKKGEMLFKEIEKRDKASLNLVRDLITLGANLDWQNEDGQTVLHKCARWNSPEIARMLLDAGADVNVQDGDGWTALHVSAFNNRLEITQVLIDAGADKTIPNNDGELPYELPDRKEFKELLKP
jgi:ankyrin repeat protein